MPSLKKELLELSEISANDLKRGMYILENNIGYRVLASDWTKPGKGPAFINTELKSFDNEKKYIRFRSTQKIYKIILEEIEYVYLYHDSDYIYCSSPDGINTIDVPMKLADGKEYYLVPELKVTILISGETQIKLKFPKTVILTVKSTGGYQKNQTITNSFKTSILENDLEVDVPQFINAGNKIVVDTESDTYVERYND